MNAELVESVGAELLQQIKESEPDNYPCPLKDYKKRLTERMKEKISGLPLTAKTVEPFLESPTRFCQVTAGRTKSVCLPMDKPKDPKEYLTETFIDECAKDALNHFVKNDLAKYPCSKKDFIDALLKEINQRIPQGNVTKKDLESCLPKQSHSFQSVISGNSEKICLPGHELLANPPTKTDLKKVLLELIELRNKIKQRTEPVDTQPVDTKELESLFWREHKRLDEIGFRDRAVPIPKLWNAMKDRITRKQFETILQTLADRHAIQLERRTTQDGLSQEEKDACYQVNDFLFYIARRLS